MSLVRNITAYIIARKIYIWHKEEVWSHGVHQVPDFFSERLQNLKTYWTKEPPGAKQWWNLHTSLQDCGPKNSSECCHRDGI